MILDRGVFGQLPLALLRSQGCLFAVAASGAFRASWIASASGGGAAASGAGAACASVVARAGRVGLSAVSAEGVVLLELALLAELRVAPGAGVAHDEVHLLDALSAHVLGSLFGLRSHADGEESQVAEADALAVEDELLQAVECIGEHTVDTASRVGRAVVGDVVDEVFERQLSVGYHRGVPLFLTSVFTQGWNALYLTILQCSFCVVCHSCNVFNG